MSDATAPSGGGRPGREDVPPDVGAGVVQEPATPQIPVLSEPRDGTPPVVDTPAALARTAEALAAGWGSVAIDAERAGGYRYSQRAYLVQFRREGSGTHLVDPIPFGTLAVLQDAVGDAEWVLHAASQDLPCLRELDLEPTNLFDTELAGRLLGYPRVGLALLLERVMGLSLAKEHSAADWSTRPLPEPWLRYAALDVEVLLELREALGEDLVRTGKLAWAEQEFAAVLAAPGPVRRVDPWRRTSGLHRVRPRRSLAVVEAMWWARDDVARRRDSAPGRVLPDTAIIEAALAMPSSADELAAVKGFAGRGARRSLPQWWAAVHKGRTLPDDELPLPSLPSDGPPPARAWPDRDPAAAARLAAARATMGALAAEHDLPVENLLSPDTLRRLCWTPPDPPDEAAVATFFAAAGARRWQVELAAAPVAEALAALRSGTSG